MVSGTRLRDGDHLGLLSWITRNGGEIDPRFKTVLICFKTPPGLVSPKICFSIWGKLRGVECTEPLEVGEILFDIPFDLMMTSRSFEKSDLKAVVERYPDLLKGNWLCVHLMYERVLGENSFFYPYINILPKSMSTPLFNEELLQSSGVVAERTRKTLKKVKR